MPDLSLDWGDAHIIFDDSANRAKVFRKQHEGDGLLFECEMRNATVNDGFGHHGWCPRGTFLVGAPSDVRLIPFGFHFTPIFDMNPDGPMHQEGRRGVGIHGGGSGLANPFAACQGWQVTLGCLRVLNMDNATLVKIIREVHGKGRKVYITVSGTPG